MPRTKLTKADEMNKHALAVIEDWRITHGVDKVDFGSHIGLSQNSGYNRLKNPDRLTIAELRRMRGLTDDQIIRMVRGKMPEKQPVNIFIDGSKLRGD